MAALITNELGLTPELIEGGRGEFTVWVDGARVAQKDENGFPTDADALDAVRRTIGAG